MAHIRGVDSSNLSTATNSFFPSLPFIQASRVVDWLPFTRRGIANYLTVMVTSSLTARRLAATVVFGVGFRQPAVHVKARE